MPRIIILADDLSGAADCGIACVNAGLKVVVTLGSPSSPTAADVIAIDADTRGLGASPAAERMRQLVQMHAHDPALLLFKKIDSTLRGHIGPELAAVLDARRAVVPRAVAIMAPSFPANGRTTVEGMHYVHGEPLHKTEMWKNEKMPGQACIPDMLTRSALKCAHLNLALVRSPRAAFDHAINDAAQTADVIVCDAATDDDLRAVAEAAMKLQDRALWVGSAGLAQHLPKATGLASSFSAAVGHLPETAGSTLFVIGSASRTTRQQVAELLSASDIRSVVVPSAMLLEGSGSSEWNSFTSQLAQAAGRAEDVILLCDSDPAVDLLDRPRLSQALAEMAVTLRAKVGAIVVTGGETARKVLNRWGVLDMQLHGELESGVAISSTIVDGIRPLTLITKAGDFGQRATLLHCREWLSKGGVFR
jgi:D-threonate/D-erythronate kinase